MKEVILTKGLPASGKSTWAKKQVLESTTNYKRVNKDDLRDMLDAGRFSKGNEAFLLTVRDFVILEALNKGYHVIVALSQDQRISKGTC
jgi:predicted kinase